MSVKIQAPPVAAQLAQTSALAAHKAGAETKAKEDAAKVGRDFEAILVRSMLSHAKVAGEGGYADMAVESLAQAVTQGGGLGLGRQIQDALSRTAHTGGGGPREARNSAAESRSPSDRENSAQAPAPPAVRRGAP